VTVKNGDTVQSLASRMACSDAKAERFRVPEGIPAGDTPKAGQKMKIIVRTTS
jgi:predicted Zn-dependent protease